MNHLLYIFNQIGALLSTCLISHRSPRFHVATQTSEYLDPGRWRLKGWQLLKTFILISLSLSACQPDELSPTETSSSEHQREVSAHKDSSAIIARVGEVVITEDDVKRHLTNLSSITRARYQSPERRQELLSSLIRFELLSAEAQRRGHHKHPDVELTYKQAMVRELLSNDIRHLVKMSDIFVC